VESNFKRLLLAVSILLLPFILYADSSMGVFGEMEPRSRPLWTYRAGGEVRCLAVSGDGNYIAAGCSDNRVYLFSTGNGTPLWSFSIGGTPRGISISENGDYIGVVADDGNLYLFGRREGTPLWSRMIGYNRSFQVLLTRDGGSIFVGTDLPEDPGVFIFESSSQRMLWRYECIPHRMAVSGDERYLAVVDNSTSPSRVLYVEIATRAALWRYPLLANDMAISLDGEIIAIGSGSDGYIYCFRRLLGIPIWAYSTGGPVGRVRLSGDGRYIAALSMDQNLYLFDRELGRPLWSYKVRVNPESLLVSSDYLDYIFVTGGEGYSYNTNIYCLSRSGTLLWMYRGERILLSMSASRDGRYVAAGDKDKNIYLFLGAPLESSITCSISNSSITRGDKVTIFGSISPSCPNVPVSIYYKLEAEVSWRGAPLATVKTDENSSYTYTWSPPYRGVYHLIAYWEGDGRYAGGASQVVSLVVKERSEISCILSIISLPLGSSVTISGGVYPPRPSAEVHLMYSLDDGKSWSIFANVTADTAGRYSYVWRPTGAGSYLIRSGWEGDAEYGGASSPAQAIRVLKRSSNITCSILPTSITIGSPVTISGHVSPPHPAPVTLQYSLDGGVTWENLTTLTPAADGSYSHTWGPSIPGSYGIRAILHEDADHTGAESPAQNLSVGKGSCSITCTVSPQTLTIGGSVEVSGRLEPSNLKGTLTLRYTRPDGTVVTRTAKVEESRFADLYTPDRAGSWNVTAIWPGDVLYLGAEGHASFKVSRAPSSITQFQAYPEKIRIGEPIAVTGSITPPLAGISITLTYRRPDGTTTRRTLTTTPAGAFNDSYRPDAAGAWAVEAYWEGNTEHEPAKSISLSFTVEEVSILERYSLFLEVVALIGIIIGITVYITTRRRSTSKKILGEPTSK
jgi:outer membrane protein assembly factor BamB